MITQIKKRGLHRLNRQICGMAAGIMLLGLFCFTGMARAGQDEAGEAVETKRVQGEVSSLSPQNNPRYIGITYNEDPQSATAQEIVLFIDKDVKLVHKGGLSEIGIGDTVEVIYDETSILTEEGQKKITSRIAKVIRFARGADQAARYKYWRLNQEEKEQEQKAIRGEK